MKQPTCAERIDEEMDRELETLRIIWYTYTEDWEQLLSFVDFPDDMSNDEFIEQLRDDYGEMYDHGLSFDYVEGEEGENGYWRYQISWGGPADEFRFYTDHRGRPYRVEYWFLDWYDGAFRTLRGADLELLLNVWEFFEPTWSQELHR